MAAQLFPKTSYQAGYGGGTSFLGVMDGDGSWALSITFGVAHTQVPVAADSVFRHLAVYSREVFPGDVTITLLVDGVASALAVTLPAGATTARMAGPDVTVLAGQDVAYRYTGPLVILPGLSLACCVEREGAGMVFGVCAAPSDGLVGQGWIGGAFGNGVFEPYNTAAPHARSYTYSLCAVPGAVTGLCLRTYSGAPGASAWTGWIVKNGVTQDGTGGTIDTTTLLTGAATVASRSFAVPGTYLDRFDVLIVRSGTAAGFFVAHVAAGVAYTPTVDGVYMLCGGSGDALLADTTAWKWTRSQQMTPSVPFSLFEAAHLAPISGGGLQTLGLYVERTLPPGDATALVHTLRRNEADTPLAATLSGAATSASATYAQAYAAGDTITLQIAPVGTPISTDLHWGVAVQPVQPVPPSYSVDAHVIRRLRRAPHVQQEHKRIAYARFALDLERGVGLPSGQGSDPLITLRLSRDGGQTWGEPVPMRAGKLGAYQTRVLARRLGHARDAVFEVTVSDPVAWSLVQAWIDLEAGTS